MHYLETYNASEGFFAYQDDLDRADMALLMDHGVYYEFVPLSELDKDEPQAFEFREVEEGETYALVVSTSAGLWRVMVGDLVTVTSRLPLRIQVTGRISSYLNLVGEELMVQQSDKAWAALSTQLGTAVYNYLGGAALDAQGKPVGHQWVVEFQQGKMQPEPRALATRLDRELKTLNGDYAAKRMGDLVLGPPQVHVVPSGTFDAWMKAKGRLGGQHKVPRLSMEATFVKELLGQSADQKQELSPTC